MRLAKAVIWLPVLALLHIHLHHHFHGPEVDYLGVAAGAAASWVGVPGPGEPLLVAAGVLAAQHKLDIGSVIFVAWAGATAGGIGGWLVGRGAGRALITAPGPLHRTRLQAVQRGERVFARYPVIAIVLTPSWIAGINNVKGRIYHPTNAASAALWAAGIGFGAYLVGPTVVDAVGDLGTVLAVILVIAVVGLVGAEVRRRRRRPRDEAPPTVRSETS
ncbi:MAG: DedA family protein [Solirubrobacteraceae bacterium]